MTKIHILTCLLRYLYYNYLPPSTLGIWCQIRFKKKKKIIFPALMPNLTVGFYWNIKSRLLILTVLMLNEK